MVKDIYKSFYISSVLLFPIFIFDHFVFDSFVYRLFKKKFPKRIQLRKYLSVKFFGNAFTIYCQWPNWFQWFLGLFCIFSFDIGLVIMTWQALTAFCSIRKSTNYKRVIGTESVINNLSADQKIQVNSKRRNKLE